MTTVRRRPRLLEVLVGDHRISVADAKDFLRAHLRDGKRCIVCGSFCKLYDRPINSGQVRALLIMYREFGTRWCDKRELLRGVGAAARDESQLKHWGLIEPHPEMTGYWRVTLLGEDWICGRVRVPKYHSIYLNVSYGSQGPMITVSDALEEPFDLAMLMA